MLEGKTFLAIIPARMGSKRVARKNRRKLAGKPLVSWTLEAALNSSYLDEIVVTTDDPEILSISRRYDVVVLRRPRSLARDSTPMFDVVRHATGRVNKKYDYVVLLQPTSPLRTSRHIDEAIEKAVRLSANVVLSVSKPLVHCEWGIEIVDANADISSRLRENLDLRKRSQELSPKYVVNGAIYVGNLDVILSEGTFYLKERVYAYVMPQILSVDIDTEVDFTLAECIMRRFLGNKETG